jgi:hypothetical protein
MKRLGVLVLSTALALPLLAGCGGPTPEQCQTACEKALKLAKSEINAELKTEKDEVKNVADSYWMKSKTLLEPSIKACVDACVKMKDDELIGCLNEATSLNTYKKCIPREK